jgi:proteic killer suppression protein
MRFAFKSEELEQLYETGVNPRFHPYLVRAFFRVLARISAATDERDIRSSKALRLEKLKGDRDGQFSVRLNDQWRLVITFERDLNGQYIIIVELVDYH